MRNTNKAGKTFFKAGKVALRRGKRVYSSGMENTEIEKLQKELNRLGIISIEADSGLSGEVAKRAIDRVKSVNLDFTQLAKTARQKRAAILNEE